MADYKQDANAAKAKGELLISDYSSTPYSQLAAMLNHG